MMQKSEVSLFHATGLVLNPNPESESEDSEPEGPDDPVIPSPEMDDVKGESFTDSLNSSLPLSLARSSYAFT